MANTSWNPADHPNGSFSPIQSLIRDALRDLGETAPDSILLNDSKRFLNYANRVLQNINRHPYYTAIVRGKMARGVGAITAGDTLLTLANSSSTLENPLKVGTPVLITGAGSSGGDLITKVVSVDDAGLNSGQLRLFDEAETTVTDAVVRSPYESALKLYVNLTDIRAIEDMVMVSGLKYFMAVDGITAAEGESIKAYLPLFQSDANGWLADLVGLMFELEVETRDA